MDTRITSKTTPEKSTNLFDWKVIVRFALIAVVMPLILFVTAGQIGWWQGWLYAILTLVMSVASRYIVFLKNPALITERARFTASESVKEWDKRIVVSIAFIGPLIFMIAAGLDKRFGWSAEMALSVQLIAFIIFLIGFVLSTWAMIENAFFSSVVRIQTNRGQTVVTTGPYRFVRHPGYSGAIVSWLVSPIPLGSLWSFIPVGIIAALYIVRTALEDRTLQAELLGYTEYTQRTRYRLLPFVW